MIDSNEEEALRRALEGLRTTLGADATAVGLVVNVDGEAWFGHVVAAGPAGAVEPLASMACEPVPRPMVRGLHPGLNGHCVPVPGTARVATVARAGWSHRPICEEDTVIAWIIAVDITADASVERTAAHASYMAQIERGVRRMARRQALRDDWEATVMTNGDGVILYVSDHVDEIPGLRAAAGQAARFSGRRAVVCDGAVGTSTELKGTSGAAWLVSFAAGRPWTRPVDTLLTPAQLEVAQLAALGASGPEIARHRGRSPHTIRSQLKAIYERLGVASRVELARRLAVHISA